MSRVPSYPFRCVTTRILANGNQQIEQRNYTTLPGAWAMRDIELNKRSTRKVEIVQVLDESTPSHLNDEPRTSSIRSFRVAD
jgi:hypothetical protein